MVLVKDATMLSITKLSIMTISRITYQHSAPSVSILSDVCVHVAVSIIMLDVVILNVNMLSVDILIVVMLSVVYAYCSIFNSEVSCCYTEFLSHAGFFKYSMLILG
jgi:hypothetical protein